MEASMSFNETGAYKVDGHGNLLHLSSEEGFGLDS